MACLLLAGCTVGPDYHKPPAPVAARFKELAGWKPARPMDAIDRGAWWSVYQDPLLDRLMAALNVSNETIKENYYAYLEARALVDEARAGYFPTAGITPGVTRAASGSGSSGGSTSSTGRSGGGGVPSTTWTLEGSASWTPDVWGRVRRQVESNVAGAQVSAATLANVKLSEQALLATDYFELRTEDALQKLLDDTVRDYRRSLEITQNQYAVGVAARSDVITAQVQLQTTISQAINVGVARAQYEHAIAVLTGRPPADVTLSPGPLAMQVPVAPVVVPLGAAGAPARHCGGGTHHAGAERADRRRHRRVLSRHQPQCAVRLCRQPARLADFGVEPGHGRWAPTPPKRCSMPGLRASTVRAQRALYDESVASYRQTVLTAFQQVEDDLAGLRILQDQEAAQQEAVKLARRAVEISINEYRAGTVAYTTVVTAQATALADEETLLSIQQSRLTTSVALIQALGGGWTAADLPRPARPDQAPPGGTRASSSRSGSAATLRI